MNAYKCDICKNYFEKKYHYIHTSVNPIRPNGHHTLQLMLRSDKGPDIIMFNGDICPDCYGLLCEQLAARGCTEKEVLASASVHKKALEEALKEENASKPIGDFSELIEYLSHTDENDAVKIKYIRQKIEDAIGENIDWYERRKS